MFLCAILVVLLVTFRRFSSVAKFGTFYFLLKIKILAKRKREFTTKFAIARNRCYWLVFYTNLRTQTLPVSTSDSVIHFLFSVYFLRKIPKQTFSTSIFQFHFPPTFSNFYFGFLFRVTFQVLLFGLFSAKT